MTRMARICLVVCVLVSVIFIQGGAFAQSTQNRRMIVIFKPGTTLDQARGVVANVANTLLIKISEVHNLMPLINALAIEPPLMLPVVEETLLTLLTSNPLVEGVYEDTVGTVDGGRYPVCINPAPPPVPQSNPWNQVQIEADRVHPQRQGSGVTVAVLDTGIASHPELSGRIRGGYNARAEGGSSADDNGHGTHVAGIIAAELDNSLSGIIGVAPQATLLPVKVLDRYGAGYLSDVINGLQWVDNNGSPRAKVANMSIGFRTDIPPLKQAIENLWASDVIIVASAGNHCASSKDQDEGGDNCGGGSLVDCDPAQTTVMYPAAYQAWVMSVAATDINGKITAYSLLEPQVDVAAPGGSKATGRILSTTTGSGYGESTGTSQAAAHVSGAVAVALQLEPGLSFPEVRLCLQATAKGPGQIDVYDMVQALLAGRCR